MFFCFLCKLCLNYNFEGKTLLEMTLETQLTQVCLVSHISEIS